MKKKTYIVIIIIATAITSYHFTDAMFTRATRVTRRQPTLGLKTTTQAQSRFLQTRPDVTRTAQAPQENISSPTAMQPLHTPVQTASVYSYWVALKNKIFGTPSAATTTIATVKTTSEPTSTRKKRKTSKPISTKKTQHRLTIEQVDTIKSLPEAENILKTATTTELNHIQKEASISNNQWTNLIEKTRTAVNYIQQNCFTSTHQNATHDTDIPQELYDKIFNTLKKNDINPASLSIHCRDTIDIDPFGHDTVSVTGPTIRYKTDAYGTSITGYEPASITLHRQNISKLTESQFDAQLQHTITHLKQAHNQQLTLLKEAIGNEKYEQYAQPYEQALENEAYLIEPIHNAQAAKIVQHAFLEEAFDAALKEVKDNRQKHGLENKETGLMIVCAPPGDGPKILKSIASFDDLENYCTFETEKLYVELADREHIPHEKLNLLKKTNNNDAEYINKVCYQKPLNHALRDPNLSSSMVKLIDLLLTQVNINPLSVNYLSAEVAERGSRFREEIDSLVDEIYNTHDDKDTLHRGNILQLQRGTKNNARALSPLLEKDQNGDVIAYSPAFLMFDTNAFKNKSHQQIITVITHEIGHLLKNHSNARKNLRSLNNPRSTIQDLITYKPTTASYEDELLQQLNHIREIEADTTYAQHNPEIAKVAYKSFARNIGENKPYILNIEQDPHASFHTHPSYFTRYHWIKKIVELHQKEAAQKQKSKPLFAPENE